MIFWVVVIWLALSVALAAAWAAGLFHVAVPGGCTCPVETRPLVEGQGVSVHRVGTDPDCPIHGTEEATDG